MAEYYTTIGLEIHAELATKTKMFCDSANDPEEKEPNVHICPICMGHPGTLPTINKEAVKSVIKVGLALGGEVADFTEFDRKNYFYPDIPKGYQISQYKYPIVSGGELAGVAITRVHLEEDTATSKHDKGDYSLVDFNRAGVPLMELVTEPVIKSAEQAMMFAKELQLVLRYLGVSEANMEKGQMRVELNISISPDPEKFGTKVEVKNINSFRAVGKAAAFEIERMAKLLDEGKGSEIVQETRGWDETKGQTFSQRSKEDSHDYRYFPDPDLPKLKLREAFDFDALAAELPELPKTKRERYKAEFGIKDEDIESYVVDHELGMFFEDVVKRLGNDAAKVKLASNYITSDMLGLMKKNSELSLPSAEHFAELIEMLSVGDLSSRGAKDTLAILMTNPGSPRAIAETNGFIQKHDEGALKAAVEKIITANESVVAEYKGGKEASLQYLVGQVMKEGKGSFNPQLVAEALKDMLRS